jgi:hypothetical protein
MGIKYAKGEFFGMFNKNKCGNNAGIVAQQKWAKKRVEYLNSLDIPSQPSDYHSLL